MKNKLAILFLIVFALSCKDDKKEEKINKTKPMVVKEAENKFENSLIDHRDLFNKQFNTEFKIEKFGIKQLKDTVYAYALKLNESVLKETIEKYSIGTKTYIDGSKKPIRKSFSPSLKIKDTKNKYLILKMPQNNIEYIDSIDFYIYERKNWKKSGRLGGFKVRDILIEN